MNEVLSSLQKETERAKTLDRNPHPQAGLAKSEFYIPKDTAYLCGNSLGLQPKEARKLLLEELDVWAESGVAGHFSHAHSRPWVSIDETVTPFIAEVVGAQIDEVAVMGTLTSNLHFLMAAFYKPTKEKYKIIIESKAFPSDHFAVESQIQWHGFHVKDALITIEPNAGEYVLTTQQILAVIDKETSSTALLLLPGVQFYSGQAFDIQKITSYAKQKGITVGWDLAHAAGNIKLQLHDWQVDFATWCSYKYLNAGPGTIAGLFVHKNHGRDRHRLAGWWGHDKTSRFQMDNSFDPQDGAAGYQLSNPAVLDVVTLLSSLRIFHSIGMDTIRERSVRLTRHLESLLEEIPNHYFRMITPKDPNQRGAQLSLLFKPGLMIPILTRLEQAKIIIDERKPDVIRVAPVALYNTYEDVTRFVIVLAQALHELHPVSETSPSRT